MTHPNRISSSATAAPFVADRAIVADAGGGVLNVPAAGAAVFDADVPLKVAARAADAWSVRQRRQPEAETFYERPLPNT
jgi:hypothetical protein